MDSIKIHSKPSCKDTGEQADPMLTWQAEAVQSSQRHIGKNVQSDYKTGVSSRRIL